MRSSQFQSNLYEFIVTFGYTGYLPLGPGTWGSFAALMSGYWILTGVSISAFIGIFCLVLLIGTYACYQQLKSRPYLRDPQDYVIDEVCGQWLIMILLATLYHKNGFIWHLAGFFLFRLFDICKPWPISWVDQLGKTSSARVRTISLMLDDLVAAAVGFLVFSLAYTLHQSGVF